jgi:DNA-binding PadR family transcriptional regulator
MVMAERRGTWVYYRLTESARRRLREISDLIAPITSSGPAMGRRANGKAEGSRAAISRRPPARSAAG